MTSIIDFVNKSAPSPSTGCVVRCKTTKVTKQYMCKPGIQVCQLAAWQI